jgi:hypothetical protein
MIGLVYFLLSVGAIMVVIMLMILLERIYKARGGGNGWSIGQGRSTDAEIRRDVRLEAQRNARIQKDIQRMFASHDRSSGNHGE